MSSFTVGQAVFVPECVCSSQDSILPVAAVVKEIGAEGRYVVTARGDNLDVTEDEIKATAEEWRSRDAACRVKADAT